MGKSDTGRPLLVEHAKALSLRQGPWKFIQPGKGPKINKNTNTELGNNQGGQLYNLEIDGGETRNMKEENPEKFNELRDKLQSIIAAGRSRPAMQTK